MTSSPNWRYLPRVYDPVWLRGLRLPSEGGRSVKQPVALVDGLAVDRHTDEALLAAARARKDQTRRYESIHMHSDDWFSLVTMQLMSPMLAGREVICNLYESDRNDSTLPLHVDTTYGAIVQMREQKVWHLGPEGRQRRIVVREGGVLLVPPDVPHRVETPHYSAHLLFSFRVDRPVAN
ncbi:MAG TPA: hypothetical protein VLI05_06845 [Candidatus Saccharimonadia bacterium]|nr:hypothetical protein [Candidatus Saccharimonadia bacterium]